MVKKVIMVDTKSKKFMFNLGRLFASGMEILVSNPMHVAEEIEKEKALGFSKSFNMI